MWLMGGLLCSGWLCAREDISFPKLLRPSTASRGCVCLHELQPKVQLFLKIGSQSRAPTTCTPSIPQGEIFAAEGYAKCSGDVGVCIATSGPGATNLVTGLADAMLDSVPLVAITGQVGAAPCCTRAQICVLAAAI